MGPGTPSINQVKEQFGLQPEILDSILEIDNYDKAIGKITQVFNDSNILNVGYLYSDDRKANAPTAPPGQGLPSTYRSNPVQDQDLFANYVHIFNPRWTSESVLAYGVREFHLTPTGAGYEPTLDVSDTLVSGQTLLCLELIGSQSLFFPGQKLQLGVVPGSQIPGVFPNGVPYYLSIGGMHTSGASNYNSLQVSLTKNPHARPLFLTRIYLQSRS
jgi:hypothetical protein